jgi:hypothetical protein
MRTSDSIVKIAPALLKAQRKMGSAAKGAANPFFKSKYADLGSVMEVVKDPLNEEGITMLQPTYSKDGAHYVETILMHESGEYIASEALKLELNKVDMQQLGSAITYARRYTLQSLLSIPSEDDDGEATMGRTKPKYEAKKNYIAELKIEPIYMEPKHSTVIIPPDVNLLPNSTTELLKAAASVTIDNPHPNATSKTDVPKSFTTFRQQKKAEAPAPAKKEELNF